jgi:tetratricopeptide (TPR) repeat protein
MKFAVVAAIALALPFSLHAAERPPTPQEMEARCGDYTIAADDQIAACTRLLPLYGDNIANIGVRAVAMLSRGAAHARKGDKELALADYKEAIRLDSQPLDKGATEPLLFNDRCWARAVAMIELDAALADCNQALKLRSGFTPALDSRAFLRLRQGRYKDAITDYDAVIKDVPKDPYSLFGRGVAKLKSGDRAGGDADIAAAVALQKGMREEFAAYGVMP